MSMYATTEINVGNNNSSFGVHFGADDRPLDHLHFYHTILTFNDPKEKGF